MMRRLPVRPLVALVALAAFSGCTGKYSSDFSVIVANRAANTIAVVANGNEIGQVAAGQSATFTINAQETNTNVFTNGVAPTPQADVTFSARDTKTNTISTTKSVTLTQSQPTYVTFNTTDFPTTVRPNASFTFSPNNPGPGQDVFFNASGSAGTNLTYSWTFGDGTSGGGVTTTHSYPLAAQYNVTLTITSGDTGTSSTQSRIVTVSGTLSPLAANFTFSPATPAINQDVLFSVTTPTQGGMYSWDFGDGSPNGSGASVTHRFARAATFNVTLRVSNAIGQSASMARAVPVAATPAGTINFTFSPTDPTTNDSVFFNASSTTIVNARFGWDFGDGSSGTGATPSHQYAQAHIYSVTLTVTNDLGQSVSLSKTVTVTAASFTVDFTFSPTNPAHGTAVRFDATGSGPSVASYAWDYGDGTTDSGVKPTHTYAAAGTYVVRLTITDANGRTATTTKTVPVS
jgi:PKD repeat protein